MADDRLTIFNGLKKLLKAYEPPLTATSDFEGRYELVSKKEVEIAGRKRKEISFAAAIVQSNYVGFYFMPVYADPSVTKKMPPELMKTLKGKSCFHIKSLDKQMAAEVADALKIGFAYYKEQGWV
ncbi:MAG: DUF1801 domain-containing protein [candidate division Zixibacteria bacterium]|nr:DUF1801 domain-containing protein [candidate division Zixibacteria bacterium]